MAHGTCCSGPRAEAVPAGPAAAPAGAPREIDSRALFGEARTVAIRHGAETYTLRITRSDKLILTK